jgi:hypothetical protein
VRPREGIIFLLESAARLFCRRGAAQEIIQPRVNIQKVNGGRANSRAIDPLLGTPAPINAPNDETGISSPENPYRQVAADFGPALGRLARAYESDHALRQDLLQDIHVALWRSLSAYDGRWALAPGIDTKAQAEASPAFPPDSDIRNILAARIGTGYHGVGIVVGVIDPNGRRIVSYGSVADGDSRTLNGDTVFETGSITKSFTGLLLADMINRGEVHLNDPVQLLLPARVPSIFDPLPVRRAGTWDGPNSYYVTDNCHFDFDPAPPPPPPPTCSKNSLRTI